MQLYSLYCMQYKEWRCGVDSPAGENQAPLVGLDDT